MRDLDVVVLAAGKGTRMNSTRPKVLHELAGRPLLSHVLESVADLAPRQTVVVVGFEAGQVRSAMEARAEIEWVEQQEQLGTGHAVEQAMHHLAQAGVVLVAYGDVPMVKASTLKRAAKAAQAGKVGLITAHVSDPAELGRIVRDDQGSVSAIVEYEDADTATRALAEINSGIVAAPTHCLREWLACLNRDNAQGEYYLTDIIAMAVNDGVEVESIEASESEVSGVNDRAQLAEMERTYQREAAMTLMLSGVTIADPARLDVRGQVTCGQECFIDINVVFTGSVVLGRGVRIGAGVCITDAEIGDGTRIEPHSVVEGAQIAKDCSVGPFARVRPGSVLDDGVKVGNFVETKKARLGKGTKASHLAYLGDTTLGAECNVGAGTVTCNYDGIDKHSTEIGNDVFVGTNSTLVAPLVVEDGAFVAAGSVVTTKVESGDLAVGRGKQRNIKGWTRPDKRDKG